METRRLFVIPPPLREVRTEPASKPDALGVSTPAPEPLDARLARGKTAGFPLCPPQLPYPWRTPEEKPLRAAHPRSHTVPTYYVQPAAYR